MTPVRSALREFRRGLWFNNKQQAKRRIGPTDPVPFSDKRSRKEERFFVPCCAGMEDVAAAELSNPLIGATAIEKTANGVSFRGRGMKAGYAACLWHRTANRVLHCIHKSKLPTNQPPSQSLAEFVSKIRNLENYLKAGQRIGVKSSVWGCTTVKDTRTVNYVVHASLKKEAERRGYTVLSADEGSVNVDVPFYVSVYRNYIVLYRDLSGPALNTLHTSLYCRRVTYRCDSSRGYRRVFHPAALTEASAAGLLYMADWHRTSKKEGAVFVDPMCGSGTLLCEAALMATKHAPGLLRPDWPFINWPDYDASIWSALIQEAQAKQQAWHGRIVGCDIHPIAVDLGKEASDVIGMQKYINVVNANCRRWNPDQSPDLVITNPPWGLKQRREFPSFSLVPSLKESWRDLGEFLWRECKGCRVSFVCNHPFLYKQLGLHVTERHPVWINGTQLAVYGVRLDDADSFQSHARKRPHHSVSELRTFDDRRHEIEEALSSLRLNTLTQTVNDSDREHRSNFKKPEYS